MLTVVLYGLLAIGLMGGLFLLATRFLPAGEQIAPALRDEPLWTLPGDRSLKAVDVEEVRLPVSLRGYRFAETDELLDRLVAELRRRDDELERLYALLIAMPVSVEPETGEAAAPLTGAGSRTATARGTGAGSGATGGEPAETDSDVAAPGESAADTEAADTEAADTEAADTEAADTEAADTEAADSEAADTEAADTEAADTEAADTEAANTPPVESGGD